MELSSHTQGTNETQTMVLLPPSPYTMLQNGSVLPQPTLDRGRGSFMGFLHAFVEGLLVGDFISAVSQEFLQKIVSIFQEMDLVSGEPF